jgi:hypothetical protein
MNYLVLPYVHCVPKCDIHIDHTSTSLHLITIRSSYRNAHFMIGNTPIHDSLVGWNCYVCSEHCFGVIFTRYVLGLHTYSLSAPILKKVVNLNIVIYSFFISVGIQGDTGPEVVTAEQQSPPLLFFLCD